MLCSLHHKQYFYTIYTTDPTNLHLVITLQVISQTIFAWKVKELDKHISSGYPQSLHTTLIFHYLLYSCLYTIFGAY